MCLSETSTSSPTKLWQTNHPVKPVSPSVKATNCLNNSSSPANGYGWNTSSTPFHTNFKKPHCAGRFPTICLCNSRPNASHATLPFDNCNIKAYLSKG